MQAKKLNVKDKYRLLTRDLDWEFSYEDRKEAFPYEEFEGIKITDWDKWEDPFRLTMDAYWKYQAEKEKKLYAIYDAFAQNNGHLNISDARYVNAIKIFLTAVSPAEYASSNGFAWAGRHYGGMGARVAAQMQSIDELRHYQTQIHAMSHYNKYFDGFEEFAHMHDRVWYISVVKSFFDDCRSAGPFEYIVAVSFAFEYVLTNLLFVPFMSGAAYNGDMATVTFGFSAQSDEARHMTLGLEIIKFLLEQHEDNVPIVQQWLDKWLWRGYRILSVVAMMMDYMLPQKFMSWKEAWELYFEEAGGALFKDLERYGIKMPGCAELIRKEKDHLSHQAWWTFYSWGQAAAFHTWTPNAEEMDWLSEKYPDTFDKYYRGRLEKAAELEEQGERFYNSGLPQLCQTCQIPMLFTECGHDEPEEISYRESVYNDERFHFCSDMCKTIFDNEPEKYVHSWLPVHQIFQGNCGGEGLDKVMEYYNMGVGEMNLDYKGSPDEQRWKKWKGVA